LVTFCAEVYGPLDRGMIVLQLLKVFSQRNFVADFIQLKLSFIQTKEKFAFQPPFGRLRGNIRTSAIARWKAHVRLPIRHN